MTEVSKNWKFNLDTALQGEVAAMMAGSFNLVSAAALTYIRNVYWTVPAVKADETKEYLFKVMDGLKYGKSSKYELCNAALGIARHWVKRFGNPAAAERNVFWSTILDFAAYGEMMDFVVASVKADFGATMTDVYHALNGNKKADKAEKSLAEKVTAALAKADVPDASAAALAASAYAVGEDKVAMLARLIDGMNADELNNAMVLVNARMMAFNAKRDELAANGMDMKAA